MSKYKAILWDIDDTLLDFKKSEKIGIFTCFEKRGLYVDDAIAERFSQINDSHWKRFEKKELTKLEVQRGRFVQLFEELHIPDSVDMEEFRLEYEHLLGEIWFYRENSKELLEQLQRLGYEQYAITNGTKKVQDKKIKGTGFDKIFKQVFISDVIGTPKPHKGFFDYVFSNISHIKKEEMLVVGDSLTSDMRGGVENGVDTCWYNPYGVENAGKLPITYEVQKLEDVLKVLEATNGKII